MSEIMVVGCIRSGTNWTSHLFAPVVDAVVADLDYNDSISNEKYRDAESRKLLGELGSFCFKLNEDLIYPESISNMVDLYPDIKIILLVRNPTSVVYSVAKPSRESVPYRVFPFVDKTSRERRISRFAAAAHVVGMYDCMYEEVEEKYSDRVLVVKYEDLVENFEESLRKMYNFVGSKFYKKYLDKLTAPIDSSGNAWNLQLSKSEVNTILSSEILTDLSERYGYDLPDLEDAPDIRESINEAIAISNDFYEKKGELCGDKNITGFYVKWPYVLDWASKVNGNILDAGCGTGNNLVAMLDEGLDAFGIDFSDVCCSKMGDLPYECADIVSYCPNHRYDGILCSGALEHVPYSDIDETLEALSLGSYDAFIGIANHSDIQYGYELHPIQEGVDWWIDRLNEHYDSATFVVSLYDDRFFFIRCSKGVKNESQLRKRREEA